MASPPVMGDLEVLVIQATELKDVQTFGRQDPFVLLEISNQKFRTKAKTDAGKNPKFNERFTFLNLSTNYATEMGVKVVNRNVMAADELIGSARVPLTRVYATRQPEEMRINLATEKGKSAGELLMLLTWKPLPAQPAAAPAPAPGPAYSTAPPAAAPPPVQIPPMPPAAPPPQYVAAPPPQYVAAPPPQYQPPPPMQAPAASAPPPPQYQQPPPMQAPAASAPPPPQYAAPPPVQYQQAPPSQYQQPPPQYQQPYPPQAPPMQPPAAYPPTQAFPPAYPTGSAPWPPAQAPPLYPPMQQPPTDAQLYGTAPPSAYPPSYPPSSF